MSFLLARRSLTPRRTGWPTVALDRARRFLDARPCQSGHGLRLRVAVRPIMVPFGALFLCITVIVQRNVNPLVFVVFEGLSIKVVDVNNHGPKMRT